MTGPSAIREQRERASVLKNEQKLREGEPTTLFARARAGIDDDLPTGRYAQQAHFSGQDAHVSYPPAAEWSRDAALVGPEPSLGFAVDQMEPVEIAQSIDAEQLQRRYALKTRRRLLRCLLHLQAALSAAAS